MEDIQQVSSGVKSGIVWLFSKLMFWRSKAQAVEQQVEGQVLQVKQNIFKRVFGFIGTLLSKIWAGIKWFFGKLKFWGKKSEQLEEMVEGMLPDAVVKSSIFQTIKIWYHDVIDYIPTFEEEAKMAAQGIPNPRLIRHQNKKPKLLTKIHYKMFPRARLTYWLGDEEIIAYIGHFQHHNKFKITYRELKSRRNVVVVSAVPINYRLEQLMPGDVPLDTEIQQNQTFAGMNYTGNESQK